MLSGSNRLHCDVISLAGYMEFAVIHLAVISTVPNDIKKTVHCISNPISDVIRRIIEEQNLISKITLLKQ